ncbi:metal ABC transporter permease [Azohydromonas sediminis]|uniref:metal ABC transporter permease n=1 Tax=Azohydromonas sediminis TaxID=2259674 RepID=UPI000E658867|nr:metal ABC transporter permease [Azohydromonas sediminis]
MSFVQALIAHDFLRTALVAGLLAAVGCAVVGTLVVVKRITFMAGGIAHAVLGGMGLAHWLGRDPLTGAAVAAVVAALLVGWIARRGAEREDMLIGAVWAVGMAVGIVAIARTPGYSTDLMSYLLGNLLLVSPGQVVMMAALDALMLLAVWLGWRALVATTFDEEFARLRGLPTLAIEIAVLVTVALAVVFLMQAVGLVLVMALLTLPAATALLLSDAIGRAMVLTGAIAAAEIVLGLGLAFETDTPAGAVVVLSSAAVYLATLAWRRRHAPARQGRAASSPPPTAQGASR